MLNTRIRYFAKWVKLMVCFMAFQKSVDGFVAKYGQWSTKLGADGKPYQWLKIPGSYGGKTGVFEYTKDANGLINHRFFNVSKAH
ncbi:MAG: hypothetical protein CRN43_08135 [Candidatus Nephrothrix sp. EaCA]|nr:MAG: hypothetical protein CRN43_08135 [Candidatus Nephrothrix sp. EaCA]